MKIYIEFSTKRNDQLEAAQKGYHASEELNGQGKKTV